MLHISDIFIRNVKSRRYSLHMNLHKHQLYLLEQYSESVEIWSANNTEGKSLIMKFSPGQLFNMLC